MAFVLEAREALNHVALALSLSAAANHSESGAVVTGYSPWADLPWIMAARDQLHHEMGTDMILRSEYTSSQVDNLLAGRLDAGIVILPIKATELTVHVLRRERLLLALAEGHPLAASETIALKSLADEPFISMDASLKRTLNEYLRDVCEGSGFSPNVVQEVTSISEALELVASKIGTALVRASSVVRLQAQGVVFRECAEPKLFVEIGLAYRTLSPPPGVETFISLLRQVVTAEKRRLLNCVLSMSSWKDGALAVQFRQPFDMLVDANATAQEEASAEAVSGTEKEQLSNFATATKDGVIGLSDHQKEEIWLPVVDSNHDHSRPGIFEEITEF